MKKYLLSLLFISALANAGLPPTTSIGIGDTNPVTTFNFQFPYFNLTHVGTTTSLGVLTSAGGGTGVAAFTALKAMATDSSGHLVVSSTSATELGYVAGVTSAIQPQIDSKLTSTLTNTHLFVGNGSNVATDVAAGGDLSLANTGAFTIVNSAVTNAKMADMAQSTFKGRAVGAGTGAPVDLTATQATAILNVFTSGLQGVVPASGGGTTNFLRADGTFAAPGAGTLTIQSKSANYTILNTDDVIIADTSGGSFTLTLPGASTQAKPIYIKMKSGSVNPLTIARGLVDLIDGETTQTLSFEYQSLTLIPDGGTSWYVF